ncbi:MAG: hypothetical protein NTX03_07350 [Bacteroidetes bacterium]|nr:hypothetical protein [Bacteroidota bacterium]
MKSYLYIFILVITVTACSSNKQVCNIGFKGGVAPCSSSHVMVSLPNHDLPSPALRQAQGDTRSVASTETKPPQEKQIENSKIFSFTQHKTTAPNSKKPLEKILKRKDPFLDFYKFNFTKGEKSQLKKVGMQFLWKLVANVAGAALFALGYIAIILGTSGTFLLASSLISLIGIVVGLLLSVGISIYFGIMAAFEFAKFLEMWHVESAAKHALGKSLVMSTLALLLAYWVVEFITIFIYITFPIAWLLQLLFIVGLYTSIGYLIYRKDHKEGIGEKKI